MTVKREQINIRDPFILLFENTYYMYSSFNNTKVCYYTSEDLENWKFGGIVFEIPSDFWAYKDVWAPEVHEYKGKFCLFVSILGKNGLRGTQIAVSNTPYGRFTPLNNRASTPCDKSCIDGTLFVQHGVPYMVYSHDWPDNLKKDTGEYIGEICAIQLSEDLKTTIGEPFVLFGSNEVPLSKANPHHIKNYLRYGSDAPFLQTLSNGSIYLTWSPFFDGNYVVLGAVSKSGDIHGPWNHIESALYSDNGGHAMFFNRKDGSLCMTLHGPEIGALERALIFEMQEEDGKLKILREI